MLPMMPQRRPGPPGQRVVDVGGAQHILGNEVIDLARQRGLQAVGDVARHFLVEAHRLLARSTYRIPIARWIVSSEVFAPPTISTSGIRCGGLNGWPMTQRSGCDAAPDLDFAHREPRRARRDDHVGRQQLVELPIELLLEIDPLGPVLLDEVGACERFREVGRERQVRLRRAGREAQSLERRPGGLHELPQRGFRVRRDVGRDDLQSLGEEQRGPARADHAGADDGDAANGLGVGHVVSPMRCVRFRRRRCR